jgi:hypothetical protein
MDPNAEVRHAMTITISLSPEQERTLTERAAQHGQDPTSYAHRLLTDALEALPGKDAPPAPSEPASSSLAAILAPVHEDFRRSGMTENELDELVEEVREEIWQEQHGRPSKVS